MHTTRGVFSPFRDSTIGVKPTRRNCWPAKTWHVILATSGMIDLLLILLAFVLGYLIFVSTAYFLAKWMLTKIENDEDFAFPKPNERQIHRTLKNGRYLAK